MKKENKPKGAMIRLRFVSALIAVLSVVVTVLSIRTIWMADRLIRSAGQLPEEVAHRFGALLGRQELLTALLLGLIAAAVLTVAFTVLHPLGDYVARIRKDETLPVKGAYELRYLAEAYNAMLEEHRAHQESLRYEAEHDALTGLYNRGAFDRLRQELEQENVALLLVDVDRFKEINDAYGHDVGDQVLKQVGAVLSRSFRTSDYACRIGGDEFAVIMTDMTPELRDVVVGKLERVTRAEGGHRASDSRLPSVTLSVGVAFAAQRTGPEDNLYNMADEALYHVKEHGRNGYAFYGDA